MKSNRSIWVSIAALVAATAASIGAASAAERDVAPSGTAPNLKLLTWNIQMLPTALDFTSEKLQKKQKLRAPWIIEYLNQQDYDVVVLQEVIDKPITAQLKEGLKTRYPFVVAAEAKQQVAGCSGGILFASRVPIKYVAHIVYENLVGVDKLADKGCVLVEGEQAGVTFQIVGTHLQAGNDEVNEQEFPEIRDRMLVPFEREGVPQFLVGDMNVAAAEPTFERLLAVTGMRSFPLDDASPYTVDGENSWNASTKKRKHIDHVLVNPRGTGTTILRQSIQRARREHEGQTIDYSDHYGVVAEIQLKP